MKIEGKVIETKLDNREIVDKTGVRKTLSVYQLVIQADGELMSIKSYEPVVFPKPGEKFVFEPRKYEKYGLIAEVVI